MRHARSDYMRIQDPENIIPMDEPVFLIRSSDLIGPKAVEYWADKAEELGASDYIVAAARRQAEEMRIYQQTHNPKVPDMKEEDVNVDISKDFFINDIQFVCRKCKTTIVGKNMINHMCPNCGVPLSCNVDVIFNW